MNESAGTIAIDSSGNNNNGTYMGNPFWEEDALYFSGVGQYLNIQFYHETYEYLSETVEDSSLFENETINFSAAVKLSNNNDSVLISHGKVQTFTASEFCADKNQKIKLISHGKKKVWNLYNLYKKHEFSIDQWRQIKKYCDN